jgi:hypothetical protein
MNPYQKVAVLIIRFAGAIILLRGVIGPAYILIFAATGQGMPQYPMDRWIASVVWSAGGLALFLGSKPIGRLMGRGLDQSRDG